VLGQVKMIKNIFWDVDGVLADLNHAYFHFLTQHPNWRDRFKGLKYQDLPKALPILPKYGSLELKSHPEYGAGLDRDFCASPEFFNNRPLYPDSIRVLKELNKMGFAQITASATFDVPTKTKLLQKLFADVLDFLKIECVRHGTFMHDTAKEDLLRHCCDKYNVDPKESVLVDDRIYNLPAGMNLGMQTVRMRSEFTTDSPPEYAHIAEVKTPAEFLEWIKNKEAQ
jgi:FMN phosphatase YigB (HAD superfamily)